MIVTFLVHVFKIFSAFTENMLKVLAIHVFKQIPLTSSHFNNLKTKYIVLILAYLPLTIN